VTNGAYDLFKILNDTFAVYNKCSHPEVAESLLNVVKEVIEYYQSLLETMIVTFFNEDSLSNNFLKGKTYFSL